MERIWRTTFALWVAILLAPAASGADNGTISGTVADSSGKGLRGAIVSAIDQDNQKSVSVLTDTEGRFILDSIVPQQYVVRARLVGFADNYSDELDVAAGGNQAVKLVLEPTDDLLSQRTGASLFGELKLEDEAQRMSFKMSCTYCHQVGTVGFRTPEEPVDWEVMVTWMDGFAGLQDRTKKTLVNHLVTTYTGDAMEKWAPFTPPPAPEGKVLSANTGGIR
jgi:hypothetical protein